MTEPRTTPAPSIESAMTEVEAAHLELLAAAKRLEAALASLLAVVAIRKSQEE